MHFAGNGEKACRCQHWDGDDDGLGRRLDAQPRAKQLDEHVYAEIADPMPVERIKLRQSSGIARIQLDGIAPHMTRQIGERGKGGQPKGRAG